MSEKICGADEHAGCHCPRFEDMAQNCPWKQVAFSKDNPEIGTFTFCRAIEMPISGSVPCSSTNCALWYWKKK